MMARLTTLPDELRGGAWPSSARAVRCPVKSGNERDPPHPSCYPVLRDRGGTLGGDCRRKPEEGGGGHGRSVCPQTPPGLHASCNGGGDSGIRPPRKGGEAIP